MKIWKQAVSLAATAMLAWPLAVGVAHAERGDRGGGERDGGGESRGGGERGGAGNRGGGDGRAQSFSGGESRSHSGGERGGEPSRDGSGGARSARNFDGNQLGGRQNRESPGDGNSQRSFYRGPGQGDRSQGNRERGQGNREFNWDGSITRDRGDWDGDGSRDGDRDRGNGDDRDRNWSGFNRSDFDRYNNDRYSRDNWRGDDVRRNWWRGYDRNNIPFRSSWWNGYYGDNWPVYSPYRYSRWSNRPNYWWGYTTAPLLTDWLVFGFDRPRYWGYGPSANIYYQDDYVYYDNRRTIPVNDYYQQIYDLAHSVPNISQSEAESMDWRPLGVFAVGRDANAGSQRALQLAVNKDGVLTGTYFNRENGEVHPVSGMVDERTQRAAWAFADGTEKNLVFETALYNLTRDQSTMMVHYGPSASDTEVWHLVRLEQPDETGNTAAAAAAIDDADAAIVVLALLMNK